jgi:hypothetical protein
VESKQIKLSPKKNGYGNVTSYSINIGVNEARQCGFINDNGTMLSVEKILDYENKQIIIKLVE